MGFWDTFFEIQEDKMKRAGYDYNRDGHIDRKERAFYEEDFEKDFLGIIPACSCCRWSRLMGALWQQNE